MQKIKVSEIFGPAGFWTYSENESTFTERWGVTQGEGKYVGQRSVFLRTFGCNLTCPSFGLHHGEKTDEPDQIAKNVSIYKSIAELPAAKFGCDSYYSWHSGFKHLSPVQSVETIAQQLLKAAGGSFFSGCNPIHLILTGGEPMLGWQKAYPELIDTLKSIDPIWETQTWRKLPLTVETNGTKPLVNDFFKKLTETCDITWSISPKLTVSGHTNDETIFPEVVREYIAISNAAYFKFVVQSIKDFDEVDLVVSKYASDELHLPVFIMPEGGTVDEFTKHATIDLVAESVKRGYNITPRLHVMWGGNNVGW